MLDGFCGLMILAIPQLSVYVRPMSSCRLLVKSRSVAVPKPEASRWDFVVGIRKGSFRVAKTKQSMRGALKKVRKMREETGREDRRAGKIGEIREIRFRW